MERSNIKVRLWLDLGFFLISGYILLKELVEEGQITEITISAPDQDDGYGMSVSVPSKNEMKDLSDQIKNLDDNYKISVEDKKLYTKQVKENIEKGKK